MRAIILVVLMLVGWVSGSGQSGSSVVEVDIKNNAGFNQECYGELQISAQNLITVFDLPAGQDIKIVINHVYPTLSYAKLQDGIEVNTKMALDHANANYPNYILFIVRHGDTKDVKLQTRIDTNLLTSYCKYSFDKFSNHFEKELNDELKKNSNAQIYCGLSKILDKYINTIYADCDVGPEQTRQWYIDNGFDIFDVTGRFEISDTNTGVRNENDPVGDRSSGLCGHYIDKSSLWIKSNGQYFGPLYHFLNGTDYNVVPALYLLSSYKFGYGERECKDLFNDETTCNLRYWIHIPKSFNNKQEIYIKTGIYSLEQINFEHHTIASARNQFNINNTVIGQGVNEWTFKFHDWKDEIIGYFGENPNLVESSLIFKAGFCAGFADGLMGDLKFVATLISYIDRANRDLTIGGVFNNVSFKTLVQKQIFKDAIVDQAAETYVTCYATYEAVKAVAAFFNDPGQAMTAVVNALCNVVGTSLENLLFINGSYEAGYTAGQATYLALGVGAVVKAVKSFSALKGGLSKAIPKLGDDIGKAAGKTKVDDALKKSGVVLDGKEVVQKLNKIDNVVDDVHNSSLDDIDVKNEIVATSNSISDVAKKFWANHETNCTKYLREKYGNVNVGRQITVDIFLNNGDKITCRLDNLVKDGNIYKIIDAKSSIIHNLGAKHVDDIINTYSTPNQKIFYDALKSGEVQSIKPRGQNAQRYFNVSTNDALFNIYIGNSIEFLVNDVATNGYNIFKKSLSF
jgi:hypothetical protein